MPKIRPISDLRNNFKELEKEVHESGEPVFLTVNGRANLVLMSNKAYDDLVAGTAMPLTPDIKSNEDTMKNFGTIITKLMKAGNKTSESLSHDTNLTKEQIEAIMDGEYYPSSGELRELAHELSVRESTLDFFLRDSDKRSDKLFKKMLTEILDKIVEFDD